MEVKSEGDFTNEVSRGDLLSEHVEMIRRLSLRNMKMQLRKVCSPSAETGSTACLECSGLESLVNLWLRYFCLPRLCLAPTPRLPLISWHGFFI